MNQETAYDTVFTSPRAGRAEIAFGEQTDGSGERHVGRFSEGIEQFPASEGNRHVGRFSEGMEQLPESPGSRHVGSFSEGIERRPEEVNGLHIGSFGDRDGRVHKRAA
ncbi:MAG TPA: hypothetical protein VFM83_00495 [Gaiellaceae bacterium]|nr:hypothetical protein [Gaiellaceae bacterium]